MALFDTNTLQTIPTYHAGMLQAKAYRTLRQRMSQGLAIHKLSMQEWAVLGHVVASARLPQAQVAEILGVESPLATTLVNSLEKKGLVARTSDLADRRAKVITATAKGKAKAGAVENDLRGDLREWLGDISRRDLYTYVKVLQKIADKT